jgi:hypothetical protein
MATLIIINKDFCLTPALINVERSAYDKIKFTHDITYIAPLSEVWFEYSLDFGITFVVLKYYPSGTFSYVTPVEVDAMGLSSIGIGVDVLFRLRTFTKGCGTKVSTTLTLSWPDVVYPNDRYVLPKPNITCEGRGDSPTNFDVWCQGNILIRMSDILGVNYGFIRFYSNMTLPNPFGFQYQFGGAIPLLTPIPVTTYFEFLYADIGDNSSNYPWGNPGVYPGKDTYMQYSPDGTTWFNIIVSTL